MPSDGRLPQTSDTNSTSRQLTPDLSLLLQPGEPLLRRVSCKPALCSITQAVATAPGATATTRAPVPASSAGDKPIHDVVAGAVARAASQSTIHPLDTMKVRMQAGTTLKTGASQGFKVHAAGIQTKGFSLQHLLAEVGSLYKGVLGAASGAGIIIGTYFAFYSTTKRFLKMNTDMSDGSVAFVSGATAAVGSSFVKVPIAVCIRSVQAGVYPNAVAAAKAIRQSAGVRGLFTGFLPTLLEDAPDMAVKFAAYETMRAIRAKVNEDGQPSTWEDLLMGGLAGSAAAAATTPLDVVKTRMMCSASSRPTIFQAVRSVVAEGRGAAAFFTGVGPRALSNGLNSAIFFMFFEAFRKILLARQSATATAPVISSVVAQPVTATQDVGSQQTLMQQDQPTLSTAASATGSKPGSCSNNRLACLSLAIPLTCIHLPY